MWQDTVLALCQLSFVPSMLPSIRGQDKPALSTSVLNVLIVSMIAATQATLGLWQAVGTSIMVASAWAVLAAQKFRHARQQRLPAAGSAG